jgi:hypothetical protein
MKTGCPSGTAERALIGICKDSSRTISPLRHPDKCASEPKMVENMQKKMHSEIKSCHDKDLFGERIFYPVAIIRVHRISRR